MGPYHAVDNLRDGGDTPLECVQKDPLVWNIVVGILVVCVAVLGCIENKHTVQVV